MRRACLCFCALLLCLAPTLDAAAWDGPKGPLVVMTFTYATGLAPNTLLGIPGASGAAPTPTWHTAILIRSTDPEITVVRVKVAYQDEAGIHRTASLLADLVEGYAVLTLPTAEYRILGAPSFTGLREVATY